MIATQHSLIICTGKNRIKIYIRLFHRHHFLGRDRRKHIIHNASQTRHFPVCESILGVTVHNTAGINLLHAFNDGSFHQGSYRCIFTKSLVKFFKVDKFHFGIALIDRSKIGIYAVLGQLCRNRVHIDGHVKRSREQRIIPRSALLIFITKLSFAWEKERHHDYCNNKHCNVHHVCSSYLIKYAHITLLFTAFILLLQQQ